MTKEEFERGYAERSESTMQQIRELGLSPQPCACGGYDCPGWAMVHADNLKAHMDLYAPKERT